VLTNPWILINLNQSPGIFVVSSGHSDPINAFNSLSSTQHQQQTQYPTKMPRWFCPGILKYYVLIHDVVEGEDAKYDIAQYQNLALRSAYRFVFVSHWMLSFIVVMTPI
jgi:hypothetical protein